MVKVRGVLAVLAAAAMIGAACSHTFEGASRDMGKMFGSDEEDGGPAHGSLSDADVRETQDLLNLNGYFVGPVDGVVGPRTSLAIRTYQANHGLSVTGGPSPELLDHLRDVTSGHAPEAQ
ncbi:MAG: peptidoglycan-binding protein [Deltaproteobacteria bacterium]|nr:peptidoglycan-binding protein [Deltaproteobacteria bacterium]